MLFYGLRWEGRARLEGIEVDTGLLLISNGGGGGSKVEAGAGSGDAAAFHFLNWIL